MSTLDRAKLTDRQIKLIRETVAKDCTAQEFDVFIELAEMRRLDPFLGQIVPIVVNRFDPARRRMSLLISREGQRIMAQRRGDYRPASKPPRFRSAESRISANNPQGLISATVYLWKLGTGDGVWYPVVGHAHWDEFAPRLNSEPQVIYRSEIATLTRLVGPTHSAMSTKASPWLRMPRLMLAKCAEMQALRAGWPTQYAGLYDEAEFDQLSMDTDVPDPADANERSDQSSSDIHHPGEGGLTVYWSANDTPEVVSAAELIDRAPEHLRSMHDVDVSQWVHLNREALALLWKSHPRDALALKRLVEQLTHQKTGMVH